MFIIGLGGVWGSMLVWWRIHGLSFARRQTFFRGVGGGERLSIKISLKPMKAFFHKRP